MSVVLDTSAILAALWGEPGGDKVDAVLPSAAVSAVNLAELIGKLADRGGNAEQIAAVLASLGLTVHAFDEAAAWRAGGLRTKTRSLGLSLADRACIGLGLALNQSVVTADRTWSNLALDIEVTQIR